MFRYMRSLRGSNIEPQLCILLNLRTMADAIPQDPEPAPPQPQGGGKVGGTLENLTRRNSLVCLRPVNDWPPDCTFSMACEHTRLDS